ncbi:Potassium uptake protein TrkH [Spiribacter salinus M19-40]|uniref:Trk system potassium uptake protein n=1 Tax=Spiribacter salinus M19-40 TaxID=1260251 RepID=R4V295_9GAMM|nr:TrkH family potassium uptake protein [Spiribacter salinus]AGM40164.1 Potassium uptake protein TrkH [Spiribacter salinus M19-40]MBY5268605.1 potassium transporter [Spiribacter salinus]
MHPDAVQRVLGVLLMVFSLTMLPPGLLSVAAADGAATAFFMTFAALLSLGALLWLPVRQSRRELRTRDGFFVVAMFWVVLSAAGALPLILQKVAPFSLVDALFESVSGLTTTGATAVIGIDQLPISLRYYRQQLQWLGGMGIIVLAVAILPMLGIGGMQLYRAELPGPVKDGKLTPRIAETAKALWYIYLGLTVVCAVAYWLAGMSVFDAIGHAFTTIATGGFSTHDASIGYFDSALIEMIAVVFMLMSALNYSLHFMAWRRMSTEPWRHDPELVTFLSAVAVVCVLAMGGLFIYQAAHDLPLDETWHHAIFQVVSFATTTGYTTASYYVWPAFLPVLLLFIAVVGGCANSTSGGLKVVRILLLWRQGGREVMRLIHPQAQIPIKIGNRPVNERVIDAVWGFFAAYVVLFVILMLSLLAMGLDQVTAFSAVASGLANLGPALGDVAANFASVGDGPKLVMCVAMILGRLELFTLLVLFTPAFWRR